MQLSNKIIVLGVTVSISAYKAVDVASQLTQLGAEVNVIMTASATKFISPLSFSTVTKKPVTIDILAQDNQLFIPHITLAQTADVITIAPATANTIAKLATGICDNILTCTVLATKAPVAIAPAMNVNMYENSITQNNLAKLQERGFVIIGPALGKLASGKRGLGRLSPSQDILGITCQLLGKQGDLANRHITITAGGTREPIDPVRLITNRASGKMGYALAEAARDRGANVTLISTATYLNQPAGINIIEVETAQEMYHATQKLADQTEVLIMAAAVADYRPTSVSADKIKKSHNTLTLELEHTQDILSNIESRCIKVGFAAESSNVIENARQKLQEKHLALIVANDITAKDSGFGIDYNRVAIIDGEGKVEKLPLLTKKEVADKILNKVAALITTRKPK